VKPGFHNHNKQVVSNMAEEPEKTIVLGFLINEELTLLFNLPRNEAVLVESSDQHAICDNS
jgi:hypothetical protein